MLVSLALLSAALTSAPVATLRQGEGIVHVEVTQFGKALKARDQLVTLGKASAVDARTPYSIPAAECSGSTSTKGITVSSDGIGLSGAEADVEPMAVTVAGHLTTRVKLADAELARFIPTQASPCAGQTPAILSYDATATFDLAPGVSQQLVVGGFTVTVTLVRLPSQASALPSSYSL
jgi:hypothetical protein